MLTLDTDNVPNVVISTASYNVTESASRLIDAGLPMASHLPELFTKLRSWEANGNPDVTLHLLDERAVIWCNGKRYDLDYNGKYLMWLRVLNAVIKLK